MGFNLRISILNHISLIMSHVCGVAAIVHQSQGKMECGHIWQMWRGNEFLPLINKIWTGSRHLVFWLLETLTGLRDRVRRLIV